MNVDFEKLLPFWFRPIDDIFDDFSKYQYGSKEDKSRRIFIDHNSDILAVAHLDTVQFPKIHKFSKQHIGGAGFDDRLGCAIAYTLSKSLGMDLLLCDEEETGNSTAQYHICKDYNWIVEFDRRDTEVVTYGLDNPDFVTELKKYWIIGIGSFTDICFLKTESCSFNLGIGMYYEHFPQSYFDIKKCNKQIETFIDFYKKNKDIKYKISPNKNNGFGHISRYDLFYESKVKNSDSLCDFCGNYAECEDVFGWSICEECFLGFASLYSLDT